jgi:mono/diheme cytochrome c family protein
MSGFRAVLCEAVVAPAMTPAAAQDVGAEIGEREYLNSCAQCHGVSGKGDGPIAGFLNTAPSDLTTLQEDNGGVFPVMRLYQVIEGSAEAGPHGTREMPAWGVRYDAQAPQMLGGLYGPGDQQAFVRGRILELIEHVSTLQQ